MKIIIHADDAGLCKGITDRIAEAFEAGSLERTSLMANGPAFEYAVCKLRGLKQRNWSLHLNLVEGQSLSDPGEIPLLVDEKGCFKMTFISLFLTYLFRIGIRKSLSVQIEREIEAQIIKYRTALSMKEITLDSHRHVHLIPYIFRIIYRKRSDWNIRSIRLVSEPMTMTALPPRNFSFARIVKFLVLRFFSWICRIQSRKAPLDHPEWFIGLLYPWAIDRSVLPPVLRRLASRRNEACGRVELQCHPGPASAEDMEDLKAYFRFPGFYSSPDRTSEFRTLVAHDFIDRIKRWGS